MPPTDNSRRGSKKKKVNRSQGKKEANVERSGKERTGGTFQKIDTMERLPSNAPTMAIAPSDYEHIFHEAAPMAPPPPNETPPPTSPIVNHSPSPPPPPLNMPKPPRTPNLDPEVPRMAPPPRFDVQVTPDGYTLLGQVHDGRHQALPPYVVRANNQFSRAVLVKVAKYLISRSDMNR